MSSSTSIGLSGHGEFYDHALIARRPIGGAEALRHALAMRSIRVIPPQKERSGKTDGQK